MTAPDLSGPIRTALVTASSITTLLTPYLNSFPVFTRRPVPTDAPYPLIIVSGEITFNNDVDGINFFAPEIARDITAWGKDDTATNARVVEALGYAIRDLFHHQRQNITLAGWSVTDIRCRGPMRAPTDDDKLIGRAVPTTFYLAAHRP